MNQKTRRMLQNTGVIAFIIAIAVWIVYQFGDYASSNFTDDAQVHRQIVPVNSRVDGFIKKVCFEEYSFVHRGDTLLIIDDAEYRLRLAQAKANLQNVAAGKNATAMNLSTTQNNVAVNQAAIAEAQAVMDNAYRELARYTQLLKDESVTQQQFDRIETAYTTAKARYEMMVKQQQSTSLTTREVGHRLEQGDAALEVATAAVELAELDLSYTVITAPCDGYTSRKTLQEGQLIGRGQPLLSIVDVAHTWVIANYKEKQTANISVGDPVELTVDAIPNVSFKGQVVAISNATGAQYSLLPQDNATGNFVKVEQRVPVKIIFTDDNDKDAMARLRSGLNVECRVNP